MLTTHINHSWRNCTHLPGSVVLLALPLISHDFPISAAHLWGRGGDESGWSSENSIPETLSTEMMPYSSKSSQNILMDFKFLDRKFTVRINPHDVHKYESICGLPPANFPLQANV